RHPGISLVRLNELVLDQVALHFLSADVGQHFAIHFDAGRERLTALAFHLPTESRVLDDILFGVGEVVFREDGAHAAAPAAMRFEVGGNLWLFHWRKVTPARASATDFPVGRARVVRSGDRGLRAQLQYAAAQPKIK